MGCGSEEDCHKAKYNVSHRFETRLKSKFGARFKKAGSHKEEHDDDADIPEGTPGRHEGYDQKEKLRTRGIGQATSLTEHLCSECNDKCEKLFTRMNWRRTYTYVQIYTYHVCAHMWSCNVIAKQHSFVVIAIEGQGDLPDYGRLNTIIILVDVEHTTEYFSGNIEIDSHGHVVLRVPSNVDSVAIEVEALPSHGGTASAEISLASLGDSEKGLFIGLFRDSCGCRIGALPRAPASGGPQKVVRGR